MEAETSKILDAKGVDDRLYQRYCAAYKNDAKEYYKNLFEERSQATSLEDVMKVLVKEREFALKASVDHGDVATLQHQVLQQVQIFGRRSTVLDELSAHIKTAQTLGIEDESNILNNLKTTINVSRESTNLKDMCQIQLTREMSEDRVFIKEEGPLEKNGQIFKTEAEYLQDRLEDKALNPYISEEDRQSLEIELGEFKEQELQQQEKDKAPSPGFGFSR